LMALMRASVENVIIALTVPEIPRVVRLVRASVLSLREHTMVEGARAIGARTPRILLRYILPALIAPLIVQGTYICASAILVEAYLSFLGAGTPPVIPSWGNIMAEGRAYVQLAFWIILFPGIFLAATVLAINLVGDGLRALLHVRQTTACCRAGGMPRVRAVHDILLVEDNPDARETLRLLLELEGHRVAAAETGEQGIQLARDNAFTVGLIDIGLPDLDGYTVAQRIRAGGGTGVVLIALTGYSEPEDVRRAR